jgi:hypothetical protein
MRRSAKISLGLFLVGALIGLAQLWLSLWSAEIFMKIVVTLGVLLVVSLVFSFVAKENEESKRLKDGNGF